TLVAPVITLVGFLSKRVRAFGKQLLIWWIPALLLFVMMLDFAAPVWHLLPFASYIQFVWRLLALIEVVAAVAIGVSFAALVPERKWRWIALAAVGSFAVWDARSSIQVQNYIEAAAIPATVEEIRANVWGTNIADEFLPIERDHPPAQPRKRLAVPV